MKTLESVSAAQVNAGPSSEFSFVATSKAFKLVADNLYSDKFVAIVRELSCNAIDAHVLAGKANEPIAIHIPSALEPYFEVTDFGAAMSKEFMMNGYCKLFFSTKNEDNSCIGGFGLGRLSALAYTDSYLVISRHNGVETHYSVYLDGGIPKISIIGESPTDKTGVSVQIPVAESDYNSFHQATATVVTAFSINPICNFDNIKSQEYHHKTEKWGIRRGSYTGSRVICGNVAYPLSITQLNGLSPGFRHEFFDFFVPIGSVSIAISREALSYDDATKDFLNKFISEVENEVKCYSEENLNKCVDYASAYLAYHKRNYVLYPYSMGISYRGQVLKLCLIDIGDSFYGYREYSYRANLGAKRKVTETGGPLILLNYNEELFYNDDSDKLKLAIKQFKDKVVERDNGILILSQNRTLEEWAALIGVIPSKIIRLSTLQKPKRARSSVYNKVDTKKIYCYDASCNMFRLYGNTPNENILYIIKGESERDKTICRDYRYKLQQIDKEQPIFRVTPAQLKKGIVKGQALEDYYRKSISALTSPKNIKLASVASSIDDVRNDLKKIAFFGEEISKKFKFLKHYLAVGKLKCNNRAIHNAAAQNGTIIKKHPTLAKKIKSYLNDIYTTYPALEDMLCYGVTPNTVKYYIELENKVK